MNFEPQGSFFISSFSCDNFPKFLLLYFSQLLKIQLRILPGVWGRSHQVILSLAVKTGRFWSVGDMIFGILWTQYLSSQRPEQEPSEIFRKRTDNVR